MKVLQILFVVAFAVLYLIAQVDASVSAAQKSQILAAHNNERANPKVKPAKKLKALAWSTAGASSAQAWANKCQFAHSVPSGYGQNIAEGSTGYTVTGLIDLWIAEKNKGFTDQVITSTNFENIGHYTQLVWGATTSVGCGVANCHGMVYLVCNYHPAGNYIGQRPYAPAKKRSVEDDQESEFLFYEDHDFVFERADGSCSPNATCADIQANCGSIDNGCGFEDCGTCSDASTSCNDDNNCVSTCTPTHTCSSLGRTCGYINTGCGATSCGSCDSTHTCQQGTCVASCANVNCAAEQTCQSGACVCRAGYETGADGTCAPIFAVPSDPNEDITAWTNNNGDWVATDSIDNSTVSGLTHIASAQEDLILWSGSSASSRKGPFAPSQKVSVSATFTPNDAAPYGLAFRAQNAQNYYAIRVGGGNAAFVLVQNGKQVSSTTLGAAVADDFGSVELRVISLGQEFAVYVNGQLLKGTRIVEKSITVAGSVGIFAQGDVAVTEVHTGFAKNIKLSVGTCDSIDTIVDRLPIAAGIKRTQITQALSPSCTKTREVDAPADVTFEVAGSNEADVDAIQSTLSGLADASFESTADSDIIMVAAEDAGIDFLADVVPEVVAAAAAAALGAGAIAGIAVGSVAGAGALAGAAVVVHKKVQAKKNSSTGATEQKSADIPVAKPKGAGANVFDFDATDHTSITGRTPAQKKKDWV